MQLTNLNVVRELMGDSAFKKKYGQNFLISPAVPQKIAEAGAMEGTLEIGPGIGTLTRELCARSKKVVALEIDESLIPILDKTLSDYDNVKVICSDATKVDIASLVREEFGDMPVSVCANLPYYITSPIIMQLLECGAPFKKITVMVQKEFADRLCSKAGSELYGSITAACAYYGSARKLFQVPSGCFMPRPKVDSAVVSIDLYEKPPVDADKETLMKVIRAAFSMRRKTLSNALTTMGISKAEAAGIISDAGFEPTVRGEELDIYGFAKLADILSLKS